MPIVDASSNEAPSFVHNHIYVGDVGESYSLTLSAVDKEGDLLSFRTTYLPEWLLKTEVTENTITLSGTPSEQYEGVNFFSVRVSDTESNIDEHYAILINKAASETVQPSVFSLFGTDISDLTIHSTPAIPIGGLEQPYSSVDVVFSLAGLETGSKASDFALNLDKAAPDNVVVQYTALDDYTGVVSTSGTAPANEFYSSKFTLSHNDELFDLDVSISGANQTVGHVVSTLGGVSINSAGLAGKTVFVNGVENEALVLNDSGTFEFSSVDLSETVIFEVELENSSSAIGISDVVLQLRHIVGLTELASSQFIAGDIDGDSQISISDVVSNLRVIVGLAESPKGQLVYQDEQRNYDLQHGSVYDFELLIPGDVDGSMSEII